jgi:hypothetical protein
MNPNAMHLIKQNIDNPLATINWHWLSANPSIFENDIQTNILITKKANMIDMLI